MTADPNDLTPRQVDAQLKLTPGLKLTPEQVDSRHVVVWGARCAVLFSPSWQQLDPRELAEWLLADQLDVRLQVQLHKYLWGAEPGR